MSGGGKGDKKTAEIKLPKEIEALAKRNLAAAETAGKIGYVPYEGPTVAAFNPMQINSMQQNAAAMKAFGMNPANVAASIPKAKTYAGGVQGYDPLALYTQSLRNIDPAQRGAIQSFTDPRGVASGQVQQQMAAGGKGGGGGGVPAGNQTMVQASKKKKSAGGK